jgi:hypothetical protein
MLWSRTFKPKGLPILKIVSDAGIANPHIGDGRLIPVLTLDCTECSEVSTMLELHQETPPGDVVSTWAIPRYSKKYMYLILNFTRPVELNIAIEFKLEKHSPLIDGIILSKGLYIRSCESSEFDAPSIVIEVPEETIPEYWSSLYQKLTIKKLKREGYSKKHATNLAIEHIKRMRELWGKRMHVT